MAADAVLTSEAIGLARNQEDLLEAAVREHSRLVYRIAHSVLRDPAEAEDATQETFLRALRYGRKFALIDEPKAWLARVAWRVAVERRRQKPTVSFDGEGAVADLQSTHASAEAHLLQQERSALLGRLVEALPEELREALVLLTTEEIAPREVAAILGISEAAVRSRAFRARQILRDKLAATMGSRK